LNPAPFRSHAAALWRDPLAGLASCLDGGIPALPWIFCGLAVGWWVYVPLHELLHAWGCLAAGGEVSRLEIDPLYGGRFLALVFPWVASGGEYAGRLSGFDTHGSDLVYLATDLAPYLLTLWPGLWGMRRAARARRPLAFGFWLPCALAPLVSLTGDAYEIGSLLVRRFPAWSEPPAAGLLLGDDLPRKVAELAALGALGGEAPWGGVVLAALAGGAWAWGWIVLASVVATGLGQPPLAATAPTSPTSPAARGGRRTTIT
jgi:hypothetical protein